MRLELREVRLREADAKPDRVPHRHSVWIRGDPPMGRDYSLLYFVRAVCGRGRRQQAQEHGQRERVQKVHSTSGRARRGTEVRETRAWIQFAPEYLCICIHALRAAERLDVRVVASYRRMMDALECICRYITHWRLVRFDFDGSKNSHQEHEARDYLRVLRYS